MAVAYHRTRRGRVCELGTLSDEFRITIAVSFSIYNTPSTVQRAQGERC